mgnify:CR=1 FL=1
MKRFFVLPEEWLEQRGDKLEALDEALMSLKLTTAEDIGNELFKEAMAVEPGIRVSGAELDWVVRRLLEHDPDQVKTVAQTHWVAEELSRLRDVLKDVLAENADGSPEPNGILKLAQSLESQDDIGVIALEEQSELEIAVSAESRVDDAGRD